MVSMTKKQLAAYAGVSVRTLMRWCEPHRTVLEQAGMTPTARVLPPSVVGKIVELFCIDVPERARN